jgi:radical SAM protein with 4Fe4S-binding SPASM domain
VAVGIQQITYVGGEPLLFPGITDVIQHSQALGMKSALVTNGTLLSQTTGRHLLEAGLHTLIVSLDGPLRTHDLIRGKPGTFSRVYENLMYLSRAKKTAGRRDPRINIYTTLSRLNRSAIPSILASAQRLDVNSIRFQLVSVVTPDIKLKTEQLFSSAVVGSHSYAVSKDLKPRQMELADMTHTLAQSFTWARRTGIQIQMEKILTGKPPSEGCTFIENSMVINPAGEVLPCPMLTGLSIGNLNQSPLSEIWGNPGHQAFLNRFHQMNRLPICQECCVEKLAPPYPEATPNRSA